MARIKASRLKKVAESLGVILSMADADERITFDDLPKEDQDDAYYIAKHVINLYDGLRDRGSKGN